MKRNGNSIMFRHLFVSLWNFVYFGDSHLSKQYNSKDSVYWQIYFRQLISLQSHIGHFTAWLHNLAIRIMELKKIWHYGQWSKANECSYLVNVSLIKTCSIRCQACAVRLTPCFDVPSFFSPSKGSRSAESLWKNWIACFSLLASRTSEFSRFSLRIPVSMTAGVCEGRLCGQCVCSCCSLPDRNWVEESPPMSYVKEGETPPSRQHWR